MWTLYQKIKTALTDPIKSVVDTLQPDWSNLTHTLTIAERTHQTVYGTAKEVASGAGYFCVYTKYKSDGQTLAQHKITVDGSVIMDRATYTYTQSDFGGIWPVIPIWYRYNTSYKVEHLSGSASNAIETHVYEAAE